MNLLLSQLYAMDREFDAARMLYRANAAKLAELQAGFTASSTSLDSARVEMLAGDYSAAEELLRRDFDALQAMDERYLLTTVAGLLGRALVAQGKTNPAIAERLVLSQSAVEEHVNAIFAKLGLSEEPKSTGVSPPSPRCCTPPARHRSSSTTGRCRPRPCT